MTPIEQKTETLSQAILNEAQAEADQILAEARAKADAILRQAEERTAAVCKEITDRGMQEVARLRGQAVATAQLKARSAELEHREKLLNDVFNAARQKLRVVLEGPHYAQVTRRFLAEALSSLGAKSVKIHADPATSAILTPALLDELAKEYQVEIQLAEPTAQNIGIIVETADGHMNFDNTLETRLDRLQSALRYSVYQLLVGETQ